MIRHCSHFVILFILTTALSKLECHAETPPPSIPLAQLDHYKATLFDETVESMIIERLRLVGPQTVQLEVPPDWRVSTSGKDASATFNHRKAIGYEFKLYSFPKVAFKHKLKDTTLNAYMQHLSLTYAPEAEFEIIEAAEFNNGRAKFRILGKKALTIRYAFNTKEQRTIVAENWIEEGDRIYVVSIVGPQRVFDSIFKTIRIELNSMHLVE